MKSFLSVISAVALSGAAFLSAGDRPAAAADLEPVADDSGWTFSLTPYVWLAGLTGDVAAFGGPPVEIDASIPDVLKALDIGLMGLAQARYDRFTLAGDLFWVKLSDDGPMPRGLLAEKYDLTITNLMLTGVAGYSVVYESNMNLDLVVGARYWSVDNNLDFKGAGTLPPPLSLEGVSLDQKEGWVDPLIGVKGRVDINESFFLTGWALVGGFDVSSKYMWDAMGSVGYRFNDWSAATLGFRALGVDYENGGFEYDVIQYGPMMGASFQF
jgi:hypothetical protein